MKEFDVDWEWHTSAPKGWKRKVFFIKVAPSQGI